MCWGYGPDDEYAFFSHVVGNIEQQIQCGDIEHMLKLRPSLDAASMSVILKETIKLRQKEEYFIFRDMGNEIQAIKKLKIALQTYSVNYSLWF